LRENAERLAAEAGIEIDLIRRCNFRKQDRVKELLTRRGTDSTLQDNAFIGIFDWSQVPRMAGELGSQKLRHTARLRLQGLIRKSGRTYNHWCSASLISTATVGPGAMPA
jgi:hypothetical protein